MMSSRTPFIVIPIFILLTYLNGSTAQGPTIEIQAIIRGTAYLPCNIRPPMKNDTTILVVWYRNEMDAIYSYDARRKSSESSHWKNSTVIGSRSYFRLQSEPAVLIIEDIKMSDGGSYRCRVDFQKSPTRNHKIWLQVIEPPDKPIIYDDKGRVSTYAGPFEEHTNVKFICRVHGGSPTPVIRWWRNEILLESAMTVNVEKAYVESELIIRRVTRFDLKASFTCQASNNNISIPQTTAVILDLYLSPLEVTILSSRQPLSVDRKYEIVCQTVGSRPPAKITWWKDNERLVNFTDTISADENVTISTLIFFPVVKDHNKTLTCRAMNTKIRTAVTEDSWILDITFVPVATLEFGKQLSNTNKIFEGDHVYFDCKVFANPRAYKIIWKHNGFIIQHVSKFTKVNSGVLELQNVNRKQSGNYTCFASNVEGDNESNSVQLRIMYKPSCKANQRLIYGFAAGENAQISCEVDAYPTADTFIWSYNHTKTEDTERGHRKSERKKNASVLHITSVSQTDYGYLLCSAANLVGEQSEPCVFHIIPAGLPEPPFNCTIVNQTSSSVGVACSPGFDGGQSPIFKLDVINENLGVLVANSSALTPSFYIDNLIPGTTLTMKLYAENGRGRSAASVIEASTLNTAEKHTGVPSAMNFMPYLVFLIGVTVFCVLSGVVIVGALRVHTVFSGSHRYFQTERSSASIKQNLSAIEQTIKFDINEDEEEKNPDVVPSKKADNYEILHVGRDDTSVSQKYYYSNKNTTKTPKSSSLLSSPPSPSPPRQEEDRLWQTPTTSSMARNISTTTMAEGNQIDFAELTRKASTKSDCNVQSKGVNRSQIRMEEADPCNVIRIPSQREIVTVRNAFLASQQESCV